MPLGFTERKKISHLPDWLNTQDDSICRSTILISGCDLIRFGRTSKTITEFSCNVSQSYFFQDCSTCGIEKITCPHISCLSFQQNSWWIYHQFVSKQVPWNFGYWYRWKYLAITFISGLMVALTRFFVPYQFISTFVAFKSMKKSQAFILNDWSATRHLSVHTVHLGVQCI